MSEEKRVLTIDPNMFSFSKKRSNSTNKTQKVREKKERGRGEPKIRIKTAAPPSQKQKSDTLKKKSILKMIRQQQEDRYKKLFETETPKRQDKPVYNDVDVNTFNSEFKEAQSFLENLTIKQEKDRLHSLSNTKSKTLKQYAPFLDTPGLQNIALSNPNPNPLIASSTSLSQNPIIHLEPFAGELEEVTHFANIINEEPFLPMPPPPMPTSLHGCLKNGNLPTFRKFMNRTLKRGIVGGTPENSYKRDISQIRHQQKEDQMKKEQMKKDQIRHQQNKNNQMKKKKRKKTVRRTYKVGRSKVFPRISVLVSNKTIRNNVTTKAQLLNQVPIQDIKRELMKRGFLKIGSTAPNDVLRKMYESVTMICGEIQNHNPENLVYNFMNSSSKV
jgi:hypothetical protein